MDNKGSDYILKFMILKEKQCAKIFWQFKINIHFIIAQSTLHKSNFLLSLVDIDFQLWHT